MALLTGSKNALKGAGFFFGGLLLALLSFRGALFAMAAAIGLVFVAIQLSLPSDLGRAKAQAKFKGLLSKNRAVNVLSAARFFLFGARDVWFVVGVPVFLYDALKWSFAGVGAFLALWVIGYGAIQSLAPFLIKAWTGGAVPESRSAQVLALMLAIVTAAIAAALQRGASPLVVLVGGLGIFGAVFAVNSSVHSYLILAYSEGDKVAMNVGFYYMANAAGRLTGTLLSGLLFQSFGVVACLWASCVFALATAALSLALPRKHLGSSLSALGVDAAD